MTGKIIAKTKHGYLNSGGIFQESENKQISIYVVEIFMFFSYLLWIINIANPNSAATTIKIVLINPLTPKDIRIKIVETTNPEFLIIL